VSAAIAVEGVGGREAVAGVATVAIAVLSRSGNIHTVGKGSATTDPCAVVSAVCIHAEVASGAVAVTV
jgi:hypothetical protein